MNTKEHIKAQARQEGRREGVQEGIQKGRQAVICNMLKNNLDIALITKVTGLPEAEIVKLKNGS